MTAVIAGLIALCNASLPATDMAAHLSVCQKALVGDYGKLAPWQANGYRAIQNGSVERIAWITFYSDHEPGCGKTTASGVRVQEGRTAAMLGVPFGTCVLVSLPTGYTLRQVQDRGSRANIGRAKRKGAETWIDLYRDTDDAGTLNRSHVRRIWLAKAGRVR